MDDEPLDLDLLHNPQAYKSLVRSRLATALELAAKHGSSIAVPELGSDNGHDRSLMGELIASLLSEEFYGVFAHVYVLGGNTFQTACGAAESAYPKEPATVSGPIQAASAVTAGRRHSAPVVPSAPYLSKPESVGRRRSSPPYFSPQSDGQAHVSAAAASAGGVDQSFESSGIPTGRRHSAPTLATGFALTASSGRRWSSPPYVTSTSPSSVVGDASLREGAEGPAGQVDSTGRRHSAPVVPSAPSLGKAESEGRRHSSPPYFSPQNDGEDHVHAVAAIAEGGDKSFDSSGVSQQSQEVSGAGRRHSAPSLATGFALTTASSGRRWSSPPYVTSASPPDGGQGPIGQVSSTGRRHSAPVVPSAPSLGKADSEGRRHSSPPYFSPQSDGQAHVSAAATSAGGVDQSFESSGIPTGRRHSAPTLATGFALTASSGRRWSSPPYVTSTSPSSVVGDASLREDAEGPAGQVGSTGRRHSAPVVPSAPSLGKAESEGRRHSSPPYFSPQNDGEDHVHAVAAIAGDESFDSSGVSQQSQEVSGMGRRARLDSFHSERTLDSLDEPAQGGTLLGDSVCFAA